MTLDDGLDDTEATYNKASVKNPKKGKEKLPRDVENDSLRYYLKRICEKDLLTRSDEQYLGRQIELNEIGLQRLCFYGLHHYFRGAILEIFRGLKKTQEDITSYFAIGPADDEAKAAEQYAKENEEEEKKVAEGKGAVDTEDKKSKKSMNF